MLLSCSYCLRNAVGRVASGEAGSRHVLTIREAAVTFKDPFTNLFLKTQYVNTGFPDPLYFLNHG
jgi:hypothetical protein